MKTILVILLGVLSGTHTLSAQSSIKGENKKRLLKELITIRNVTGSTDPDLSNLVGAVLQDLEGGILTTHNANLLSDYLVFCLRQGINEHGALKAPVLTTIIMINAEMTRSVEQQEIYRYELGLLATEAERVRVKLMLLEEQNGGSSAIRQALEVTNKTFKATNPFLTLSTADIWRLRWTIPIAEDWGYTYVAKAMRVAAAMAANKCSFIDDVQTPGKGKAKGKGTASR
jgi:hypothetical protein